MHSHATYFGREFLVSETTIQPGFPTLQSIADVVLVEKLLALLIFIGQFYRPVHVPWAHALLSKQMP